MTIFSITDITPAGAYCNALAAASESDRRYRRRREALDASSHSRVFHNAGRSEPNAKKTGTGWRTLVRRVRGLLVDSALFDGTGHPCDPEQEAL